MSKLEAILEATGIGSGTGFRCLSWKELNEIPERILKDRLKLSRYLIRMALGKESELKAVSLMRILDKLEITQEGCWISHKKRYYVSYDRSQRAPWRAITTCIEETSLFSLLGDRKCGTLRCISPFCRLKTNNPPYSQH